jgi:hypothetical protein
MLAIMISTPQAWGLILNNRAINEINLFNFIENQFTYTISGEN